ncbi:hypothetical protein LPJ66_000123 [Kickxella alabastrina]|uniref:Uncharacterized protein n=1 Tax=Kickxella alabastrina TaxID=61397 RepID=A0ACC1IXC0_9FUNG|nr:hypothetical protein LPJ66_000123 [Kickxella alabastrina]
MSFAPAQLVGGRVQFPASQQSTTNRLGRADYMTPMRNNATTVGTTPLRTTVRRTAQFEPETNSNPFTPRPDRGVTSAGSRTLTRFGASVGNAERGGRGGLYQLGLAGNTSGGDNELTQRGVSGDSSEYAMLGAVGGWPSSEAQGNNIVPGVNISGDSSRTPYSRPRSPAPRSASPHKSSKMLPSFLLGSVQSSKTPGTATSVYPLDSALSSMPATANSSLISAGTARPSIQMPLSSRPMSPRTSRRVSGFGSNDMLSSAYISSAVTNAGSVAAGLSALDDAPPIMTLDEIDVEKPAVFDQDDHRNAALPAASLANEDPFAPQSADNAGSSSGSGSQSRSASQESGNSQDYNDVKIRSVVISGLPADTESSTLNYFREFGEVLAFDVVPSATSNSLAILYSEPWQAQRAISQGDGNGRVLLAGRTLMTIAAADSTSINILFAQVFPGRPLPPSAKPLATGPFTLSEALYAQSPRKQQVSAQLQEVAGDGRNVSGAGAMDISMSPSPFKRSSAARSSSEPSVFPARPSTTLGSSASILKAPTAPKARNGLLQSAIDILFGW